MALVEINWNPSRRDLRQFAGIWFPLFFLLVGGYVYQRTETWGWALLVWGPALAVSIAAYCVPALARWIFVGWMCAVFPIGWTVSHVILAIVYYLVLTPTGLVLRLVGYDPMRRHFDRKAQTYWVRRPAVAEVGRYFRQF
jgi:hypothetical protein